MRNLIKKLSDQLIELFDNKSGSLLDVRGGYRCDWWGQPKLKIIHVGKKDFEIMDSETYECATHRYNKIKEVKGNEITFI